VLLVIQCALALVMAAYAPTAGLGGLRAWFVLTFVAALLAATQDIFVDAFAVRSLDETGRGYGNTAQVAGYRFGIIIGGGGLLLFGRAAGLTPTMLACAGLILVAGAGAFALRDDGGGVTATATPTTAESEASKSALWAMLRAMVGRGVWRVAAVAVTFKLGAHAASALIKPTLVDLGWSQESIGAVVVTLGTGASLLGAALGGALHRVAGERRALRVAAAAQALTVLPLVAAFARGAPRWVTSAAIAAEHLGSGLGTTVLFAALMTATHRERAAVHYTVLTSLNAVAIVGGGFVGSVVADGLGVRAAVVVAAVLCLAPWALLRRWDEHAARSSRMDSQIR